MVKVSALDRSVTCCDAVRAPTTPDENAPSNTSGFRSSAPAFAMLVVKI
jgi:hypothetical protein